MKFLLPPQPLTPGQQARIGKRLGQRLALWTPGSQIHQPQFSYRQVLFSWLGSFLGIGLLAYLSARSGYPLIADPFGATAVLVFGVPESPLAQPRNVIGGNCIGAIVCITLVHLFGVAPWVMGLAVATTIKLTRLTKNLHPPAGAVALVGTMSGASWP